MDLNTDNRLKLGLINLLLELKGDLESCYNRANYFINKSYVIDLKIIFAFVAAFFVLLIFRSGNSTTFLINLIDLIIVGLITFLIYCSSDRFWYLILKGKVYRWSISDKRYIRRIVNKLNESKEEETEEKHIEAQILLTSAFNANEYKTHVRRVGIEIFALFLILLLYFPNAFLLNILIVGAMFLYVYLYDRGYMRQVINDLLYIALLIRKFHKKNPQKCKNFILKNELKEVRDLKLLYKKII